MSTALGIGSLVLVAVALLLVRAWTYRRASAERASRPGELADAELVYMEALFRISNPFPLVAKVDRVYRLPGGSLVLVELKTRRQNRPYLSDIVQLSAQRLAIEAQTGAVVENYAFVAILQPSPRAQIHSHRVSLLNASEMVRIRDRRTMILEMQVTPSYAASESTCRGCALRVKCDRTDLSGRNRSRR